MNRADRMLEALADGERRSRHEIFALAGGFFLTNNAAAELRARGLEIEQTRDAEEFYYRLVPLSSPEEIERLGPDGSSGDLSGVGNPDTGSALRTSASLASSEGGANREHLSSAKAARPADPEQLSIFEAAA